MGETRLLTAETRRAQRKLHRIECILCVLRVSAVNSLVYKKYTWAGRPCYLIHSCLNASIGFIRAAMMAGYRPKTMPIRALMKNDPTTLQVAMLVG